MNLWLHNAGITLIFVIWIFGSAALLAYGLQGLWRPENKWWQGSLAVGATGFFCLAVSVVTFHW